MPVLSESRGEWAFDQVQNLLLVGSLVVPGSSGLVAEVLLLEARVGVLEHCSLFGVSLPLLDQLVELQRVI
jgi:hypothetical protein